MHQPGRRVAEWRVSILDKGLRVNSGRSKVMVDSSGGKMIVNSGKWPYVRGLFSHLENYQFHHTRLESLKHLIFVPFYIILVF